MPAITLLPRDAADLAALLQCLRDWIDAEEDDLEPLLTRHGYDLIGLRVALIHHTAALTRTGDGEPPF